MPANRRRVVKLIVLGVPALLLFGYCTHVIRPPRPPFANEYKTHPDGRPPWPRWWIHPPKVDFERASFRTDHQFNLVILHVAADNGIWLFPFHVVFDEQGQLLLYDQERGPVPVPDTPDIISARDRMFIVASDWSWHEFPLTPGFARDFELAYQAASDRVRDVLPIIPFLRDYADRNQLAVLVTWLNQQPQLSPSSHPAPP